MATVRFLMILLIVPGFAGMAAAQPPGAGEQPDQVDQLAEMLDLSADQQQEIRDLIDDISPRVEAKQGQAQQLQQELQGMAGADADEDEIRQKAAEVGELTGEVTALSLILQSRVQDVFTPEQREQLEEEARRQQEMQQQQQQQLQQQMQEQMGQ